MLAIAIAVAILGATSTPGSEAADPTSGVDAEVRPISLPELLRHADQRAPQNVRARAQVELGVAAMAAARPWLPANPSVGAAVGLRTNPVGRAFEMQLTIAQRFEIAGERRARRLAAGAYGVSLRRRLDASRFQNAVQIRWAYANALLARARLRTADLVLEFSAGMVRSAEVRVDAGDLSPLRLRMAEAALAQATQARREAARSFRAACRDLARRAGWPIDDPIAPVGELDRTVTLHGVDDLVAQVLDEHPEILALRQEVRAARARLVAARRDAWPEPTLGGYFAREHEPGTPFASAVGLVTISLPLPLWRRNPEERAQARAQQRIAEAQLATRRYELEQELRRATDALATAAARVQGYARDVLPRFAENLELLRRSYELGEIDWIEVAVGRQGFLDAQSAGLETWADYLAARRDLELALGRHLEGTGRIEVRPTRDR